MAYDHKYMDTLGHIHLRVLLLGIELFFLARSKS